MYALPMSTRERAPLHDPCRFASDPLPESPVYPLIPVAFFLPFRPRMLRLTTAFVLVAAALVGWQDRAFACASLRANARIDQFVCGCTDGETPITVVSGTALVGNGRANPILTSLVVELQARQGNSVYQPVARQVLNDGGSDFPPPRQAETCNGPLAAGPVEGRLKVVDLNQKELSFDQIKDIPVGTTGINFIATFAGPLPQLRPGTNARVKVYTTAMHSDHPHPCVIDADDDGTVDTDVKTLIFQKAVRVPTTQFLINP